MQSTWVHRAHKLGVLGTSTCVWGPIRSCNNGLPAQWDQNWTQKGSAFLPQSPSLKGTRCLHSVLQMLVWWEETFRTQITSANLWQLNILLVVWWAKTFGAPDTAEIFVTVNWYIHDYIIELGYFLLTALDDICDVTNTSIMQFSWTFYVVCTFTHVFLLVTAFYILLTIQLDGYGNMSKCLGLSLKHIGILASLWCSGVLATEGYYG